MCQGVWGSLHFPLLSIYPFLNSNIIEQPSTFNFIYLTCRHLLYYIITFYFQVAFVFSSLKRCLYHSLAYWRFLSFLLQTYFYIAHSILTLFVFFLLQKDFFFNCEHSKVFFFTNFHARYFYGLNSLRRKRMLEQSLVSTGYSSI